MLLMCPLGSLGLSRETTTDQFTEKKDVSSFGAREPEPVWNTFETEQLDREKGDLHRN